MNIVALIVLGLIIGGFAKFLFTDRDAVRYLLTLASGIAGTLIGGAILTSRVLQNASDVVGWMVAVIGAVIWLKFNDTLSQ